MNKKQLKIKAEESLEYLKSVSRFYDHNTIYCVNVKRGCDYVNIEDLASKYSKKLKEAILEEFNEDYMGNLYQDWLEYVSEYFIEEYLKDNCSDDEKVKKYIPFIDKKSMGLYGRSGGWFGVTSDVEDNLEALLMDIEDMKLKELYKYHDIDSYFQKVEAIKWVLNEADKYNKGLKWKDELEFKVEEFVGEKKEDIQKEKELNQARTLAKKQGYILAKEV
jgi:hypothetical protein